MKLRSTTVRIRAIYTLATNGYDWSVNLLQVLHHYEIKSQENANLKKAASFLNKNPPKHQILGFSMRDY